MTRTARHRAVVGSAESEPWRWLPWLPLQLRYMQSQSRYRLMRAGNQSLGKSTVALADIAAHALGEHPYRHDGREKSGEYWVICASWSQSVSIQAKLHALLPPGRMHPETLFTSSRGFRGKNPAVQVQHRDGTFSIIRFKTTNQGTLDLAGATIDGALFDEPPRSEALYSEVAKRVQSTGGWISVCMTPIGAPVDWLRERVKDGLLDDIHAALTPEELVPAGYRRPRQLPNGTVCDAAWIRQIIAETPEHEVPVRIHGEWECRTMKRYFATFRSSGEHSHVHLRAPDGEFRLLLGIDHGDRPGKQVAVLVALDESGPRPVAYVLDMYTDEEGTATPEDDAEAILDMLARYGWTWADLDEAWGDRVHLKGKARQKSNRDLAGYIAKAIKVPQRQLNPPLRTVKRGEGHGTRGGVSSLAVGCRWVYNLISKDCFGVHPRCGALIAALDRWDFRDDDHKDKIDAVRYALDSHIFGVKREPRASLRTR